MNNQAITRFRVLATLVALISTVAFLTFSGCSSSTAPEGGGGDGLEINFLPTDRGQELKLAQRAEFSVSAPDAETIAVEWTSSNSRDPLGNSLIYNYVPTQLGVDTLRVQVAADGVNRSYFWVITITSTGSTLPAAVPSVTAEPGPTPGDVSLSWLKSGSSTFPLAEYVIAASSVGQITDDNWDQARELRRVTNRVGQVGYQTLFTVAADGMVPGADVWFAVRAVDDVGQMSLIENNGFTRVTRAWWLNGRVLDDMDSPVVGITISAVEQDLSTNSDVNGLFDLGPFRDIDEVELQTISSNAPISGWFDYQSAPIDSVSGRDYGILLPRRHIMEPSCDIYSGQFLTYLRRLTRTEPDATNPDATRMYKWTDYPVTVSVPDTVNPEGVDFGEAVRFAMAFWDSVMGETYFAEAPDPAGADVVFRIDESLPLFFGRVSLLEPAGTGLNLGEVIPEKVEVYLGSYLNTQRLARGVTLHEFGHVLGLVAHTGCGESGYLMTAGSTGNLDSPDPIHPDEQRAIRCIRRLTQGIDMNGYSLNR